jgi:hypothetical protein
MKTFICSALTIFFTLFLVSCTSQRGKLPPTETSSDEQLALQALADFLQSLHTGDYDKATQLYGGTYETMIYHNPSIDPSDHTALLQNACAINGAQCLQVKSASLDKQISKTEFVFRVDFLNADGTLFVLGPCCGGNATDFPPQSVFYLTVMKVDKSKFTVMDMPPYAP